MSEPAEYVKTVQSARESELAETFAQIDAGDYDEPQDSLNNTALSVEIKRSVEITFGVGGPSDWMVAELYADGSIDKIDNITYYAAWGSDRNQSTVEEGSALWRYAEYVIEGLDIQ